MKKVPEDVIRYLESRPKEVAIEDLADYSTMCGNVPNKPFTKEVTKFLKENAYDTAFIEECGEGTRTIGNMAIRWKKAPYRNTNRFSEMIYDNGGSLRAEQWLKNGWDLYESE